MGKAAIIIVLGFAVSLGIISHSITGRLSEAVGTSAIYANKTRAKNIASSVAEIYIRKIKEGTAGVGSYWESAIMGGSATATLSKIDVDSAAKPDTFKLVTIASYDSDYTFWKVPIRDTVENILEGNLSTPQQPIYAALTISSGSKAEVKTASGDTVTGYNHNLSGSIDSSSCVNQHGFVFGQGAGLTSKSDLSAKINGVDAFTPDTVRLNTAPDYSKLVDQLLGLANVTYATDYSSGTANVTFGTTSQPQITVFNGNATFGVSGAGSVSGAGIMIISPGSSGKFNVNCPFTFTGLVFIVGVDSTVDASKMEVKFNYPTRVLGAMIMEGSQTKFGSKGSLDLDYSCQAIALAYGEPAFSGNYIVDDWWE